MSYHRNWKTYIARLHLIEMKQAEIDKVEPYLSIDKSKLPFNSMFDGKWRVAVSLQNKDNSWRAVLEASAQPLEERRLLYQAFEFLEENNWNISITTGMVSKVEKQTNPNTGGTVDRTIQIKIGKALATKVPDSYDGKQAALLWSKKAETFLASGYYVIISQNPIDVLRMSDFKAIQSCHSQGGAYFHCAVEEAQGHGLVAFVVTKADYQRVKERLQDTEIFEDSERGVDGIHPVARARMREIQYAYNGESYTLPVPEKALYGNEIPGFAETVMEWSRQHSDYARVVQGVIPGRTTLTLKGGSYVDTPPKSTSVTYLQRDLKKNRTYDPLLLERVVREIQQFYVDNIPDFASYASISGDDFEREGKNYARLEYEQYAISLIMFGGVEIPNYSTAVRYVVHMKDREKMKYIVAAYLTKKLKKHFDYHSVRIFGGHDKTPWQFYGCCAELEQLKFLSGTTNEDMKEAIENAKAVLPKVKEHIATLKLIKGEDFLRFYKELWTRLLEKEKEKEKEKESS